MNSRVAVMRVMDVPNWHRRIVTQHLAVLLCADAHYRRKLPRQAGDPAGAPTRSRIPCAGAGRNSRVRWMQRRDRPLPRKMPAFLCARAQNPPSGLATMTTGQFFIGGAMRLEC